MTRAGVVALGCCMLVCGCSSAPGDGMGVETAIVLGFGDPFEPVPDGGVYPVSRGFQGLIDSLPIFRLTGFAPNVSVRMSITMTLVDVDLGSNIVDELVELSFTEVQPGINELATGLVLDTAPSIAFNKRARLVITVESITGPPASATLDQMVVLTEI